MNPCADVFNIEKIIGKTNPPKLPIAATIPDVIPISFGKERATNLKTNPFPSPINKPYINKKSMNTIKLVEVIAKSISQRQREINPDISKNLG